MSVTKEQRSKSIWYFNLDEKKGQFICPFFTLIDTAYLDASIMYAVAAITSSSLKLGRAPLGGMPLKPLIA